METGGENLPHTSIVTLEALLGGEIQVPRKNSGRILSRCVDLSESGTFDLGIFLSGQHDTYNITPLNPNEYYLVVSSTSLASRKGSGEETTSIQVVRKREDNKWMLAKPDYVVSTDDLTKILGIVRAIDEYSGGDSTPFLQFALKSLRGIAGQAGIDCAEILDLARERQLSSVSIEDIGLILQEAQIYGLGDSFKGTAKEIGFLGLNP